MDYTFRLSKGPEFFNELANHPRIHKAIAQYGQGVIDLAPVWDRCMGFEWPEGGFFLVQLDDDGLYEAHTLFRKGGRRVREYSAQVSHFLFTRTDCTLITTRVPETLPLATRLALDSGFTYDYRLKSLWRIGESELCDMDHLSMDCSRWIASSKDMQDAGEMFHDRLVSAGVEKDHCDDPIHDRFAGYLVTCSTSGHFWKGAYFYNRWAASAGYRNLIPSSDGRAVTFDGVRIQLNADGSDYEVQRCQPEQ